MSECSSSDLDLNQNTLASVPHSQHEGNPRPERPAALVHGVVEEFAQELAGVTRRVLKLKGWKDTQRIAVGGG